MCNVTLAVEIVREIKAKVRNVGVKISIENTEWKLNVVLFVDKIYCFAGREWKFKDP